jgi:hypothetical protein
VSWIPEIAKVASYEDVEPPDGTVTASFAPINGDLHAQWVHDRTWHWTGRKADGTACQLDPIEYEQSFASRAVIQNIKASSLTLASGDSTTKIRLSGHARAMVRNLPRAAHAIPDPEEYVDSHGTTRTGCVSSHFGHYYGVLKSPPDCRPHPATDPVLRLSDGQKVCVDEGFGGITDPLCVPVLVGDRDRKGRGHTGGLTGVVTP